MKISAIQAAMQTLGYLAPGHAADGEWDTQTALGYMNAAQQDNLPEVLWTQPANIDQLPPSVRDAMEGKAPATGDDTVASAALARQQAEREESDRAEAQNQANIQAKLAEATALQLSIDAERAADAASLETDARVNAPAADTATKENGSAAQDKSNGQNTRHGKR